MEFKDRVVAITGGGSGIGAASARLFSAAGAAVAVLDRDLQAAEEVVSGLPGPSLAVACDVVVPDQVDAALALARTTWGSLDIAVNSAGVTGGPRTSTADLSDERWAQTIAVNLTGTFHCVRSQLRIMREQRSGSIVNLASILGVVGWPEQAAYVASKHAVVGLTKTAALEGIEYGVRVNAIGPGHVDTPLLSHLDEVRRTDLVARYPGGRLGTAEEIAEAVAFLSSDRASFFNGACLMADGAYTAR